MAGGRSDKAAPGPLPHGLWAVAGPGSLPSWLLLPGVPAGPRGRAAPSGPPPPGGLRRSLAKAWPPLKSPDTPEVSRPLTPSWGPMPPWGPGGTGCHQVLLCGGQRAVPSFKGAGGSLWAPPLPDWGHQRARRRSGRLLGQARSCPGLHLQREGPGWPSPTLGPAGGPSRRPEATPPHPKVLPPEPLGSAIRVGVHPIWPGPSPNWRHVKPQWRGWCVASWGLGCNPTSPHDHPVSTKFEELLEAQGAQSLGVDGAGIGQATPLFPASLQGHQSAGPALQTEAPCPLSAHWSPHLTSWGRPRASLCLHRRPEGGSILGGGGQRTGREALDCQPHPASAVVLLASLRPSWPAPKCPLPTAPGLPSHCPGIGGVRTGSSTIVLFSPLSGPRLTILSLDPPGLRTRMWHISRVTGEELRLPCPRCPTWGAGGVQASLLHS